MILKASQRGGAKQLALHLLNSDDNEHVEIHELRGFVANDLPGAFQESYAISRATKCRQFLFSLSLNPPEDATVGIEAFKDALAKVEQRLKLTGQPRAIVFHEKEGRRHCHCVWSRIKDDNGLKAVHLPHFKRKLNSIAKQLYIEHGWDMPAGFKNANHRDIRNFTLKEYQAAKRRKESAKDIRTALQQCWTVSDNQASFEHALNRSGFFLAKGDRRGHVLVNWWGDVYALSRTLGIKAAKVKERLGKPDELPSVDEVKAGLSSELKGLFKRLHKELKIQHAEAKRPFAMQKNDLLRAQKRERRDLKIAQQKRKATETKQRQERFGTGLNRIWRLFTGQAKKLRLENERAFKDSQQRDQQEKEALIEKHLKQRRNLQQRFKYLLAHQQKQARELQAAFVLTETGVISKADLTDDLSATFTRKSQTHAHGRSYKRDNTHSREPKL